MDRSERARIVRPFGLILHPLAWPASLQEKAAPMTDVHPGPFLAAQHGQLVRRITFC